jgi:hypothetical protein
LACCLTLSGECSTDDLFRSLEGRALTSNEQEIIAQRVALQRRMNELYEQREKTRKVRSDSKHFRRPTHAAVAAARPGAPAAHAHVHHAAADASLRRAVAAAAGNQVGVSRRDGRGGAGCFGGQGRQVRGCRRGSAWAPHLHPRRRCVGRGTDATAPAATPPAFFVAARMKRRRL